MPIFTFDVVNSAAAMSSISNFSLFEFGVLAMEITQKSIKRKIAGLVNLPEEDEE